MVSYENWKREGGSKEPVISVIMPAYNACRYIEYAIESIRNQTFEDWELIVVDDGSSDDTILVVQKYSRTDSRLKVYHQSNSGKPAIARNIGLSMASGRFVTFLDADDIYEATRLEECLAAVASMRYPSMIFHDYGLVDVHGEQEVNAVLREEKYLEIADVREYPGDDSCFYMVRSLDHFLATKFVPCHTSTIFVDRSAFDDETLHFREDVAIGEDLYLWATLSRGQEVGFIDKTLSYYRKHSESITNRKMTFVEDTIKVVEDLYKSLPNSIAGDMREKYCDRLRSLYADAGYLFLVQGKNARSIQYFGIGYLRYGGLFNGIGIAKALLPWARLRRLARRDSRMDDS